MAWGLSWVRRSWRYQSIQTRASWNVAANNAAVGGRDGARGTRPRLTRRVAHPRIGWVPQAQEAIPSAKVFWEGLNRQWTPMVKLLVATRPGQVWPGHPATVPAGIGKRVTFSEDPLHVTNELANISSHIDWCSDERRITEKAKIISKSMGQGGSSAFGTKAFLPLPRCTRRLQQVA